jgi:hypothetical protein
MRRALDDDEHQDDEDRHRSGLASRAINPGDQGCLTVTRGPAAPQVRPHTTPNGADSQADSAGSIPVIRSNVKAQVGSRAISGAWSAVGWRERAAGGAMVWLGPRWRSAFRPRLHDPPPGYRPPRPRIPLRERQRIARQEWILEHILLVVLVPVAVAVAVIIVLMIAGYH